MPITNLNTQYIIILNLILFKSLVIPNYNLDLDVLFYSNGRFKRRTIILFLKLK